jgi:hypothetical protein
VKEILQRIYRVICFGEFQVRFMRDRPFGANTLGEFSKLGIDRIVSLPRRCGLPARCPRPGRDRLRKAGERGKRIVVARGQGRSRPRSVEIEQRGIDALARCREHAALIG